MSENLFLMKHSSIQTIDLLQSKREQIIAIAAKHGASNIRVFGSVARGEATNTSDIDLLIDLEPERSLFSLIALKQELEGILNCQVDLAEPNSLHQLIRDRVLKEAVKL